ncbi:MULTISPECIES: type II secretion system protein GspM [unclassified Pseudomonas]|uniref:type II secretion system protein GspM n=1 Tax=unclassified Pseudomonas TaxID=196821 RepID=UPI002AC93B5C|nr:MULTISPECIES: type II secretion system protein GspM [unclassified Pseudomonas]MEB0048389.1 type II secretion system protein GspM [Pseudomonas sp. Dout3]MEB0097555.1 type II secretion system protein GspM [Pseudomonas sp. DC1.2]WPX56745.1 type II secretion system protein GspM [Pseudomonas sp. DC1.2]
MNKPSMTAYRRRWQHLNGRSRVIWQGLALREKRMVAGTALVLAGLLIWLLLIQPPLKKIDYWQVETPKLRTQAQTLDALLREVVTPSSGQSLEQSLQHTLDASGLAGHYRLQATGGAWQLTFEDAPAAAVIGWLLGNPKQFSLEVVEARLQRAGEVTADDTAGTLSGTVRMDQAQGAKEAS